MEYGSQNLNKGRTKQLYEPTFCSFKLGVWCFYIGLTYIAEDILQLYGAFTNYHGYDGKKVRNIK